MKVLAVIVLLCLAACGNGFAQDTTALLIINNVPVVLGSINDKPAYFLVDTGASITILNETLFDTYDFEVAYNRFFAKGSIMGVGGRSFLKEARYAKVKLGTHELDFINKASDLDPISAMFSDTDITIAGIIGTDLLFLLGSRIDLERGIIVFRSNKQACVMDW